MKTYLLERSEQPSGYFELMYENEAYFNMVTILIGYIVDKHVDQILFVVPKNIDNVLEKTEDIRKLVLSEINVLFPEKDCFQVITAISVLNALIDTDYISFRLHQLGLM